MADDDEYRLPPGEASLRCPCGYESRPFCFVDHAYGCVRCCEVVFPNPVPFRYSPPNCNRCGGPLHLRDRIYAAWMAAGDEAPCPACGSTSLRIRSFNVHFQIGYSGDCAPTVGQIIHARIMQPADEREIFFFFSPRIQPTLAINVAVRNAECRALPDGHHVFRVVSVTDAAMEVDHLRQLEEEEWLWYFQPSWAAE